MRFRRRPQQPKPQPGRVRTRVNIEIECDVNNVHEARSEVESSLVRLLQASGYEVESFIFEPALSHHSREYSKKLFDSMHVVPEVMTP